MNDDGGWRMMDGWWRIFKEGALTCLGQDKGPERESSERSERISEVLQIRMRIMEHAMQSKIQQTI
jgi:hypothetical protein